jgi:Fe-S-cluster formation regulator IscX/YfhJ
VAELLGERADEKIVERIVNVGASFDEVSEALDDLDHQMRFREEREPASSRIAELRSILEELPYFDDDSGEVEAADEGLRIVDADELGREA